MENTLNPFDPRRAAKDREEHGNQGRSDLILTEGVLLVLHFEWNFPNVSDTQLNSSLR